MLLLLVQRKRAAGVDSNHLKHPVTMDETAVRDGDPGVRHVHQLTVNDREHMRSLRAPSREPNHPRPANECRLDPSRRRVARAEPARCSPPTYRPTRRPRAREGSSQLASNHEHVEMEGSVEVDVRPEQWCG
jgi:hypothetical protein